METESVALARVADSVMVRVALSQKYSSVVSNEYTDWVAAARMLREDGVDIMPPPFTSQEFDWLTAVNALMAGHLSPSD